MCEDWRCDLKYTSPSVLRCSGFCNAGLDVDDLGGAVSQDSVEQALMAAGDNQNGSTGMFEVTLNRLTQHRSLASSAFLAAKEESGDAKKAWNDMEVIDMTAAQLDALARRIEERGWDFDAGVEVTGWDDYDDVLASVS